MCGKGITWGRGKERGMGKRQGKGHGEEARKVAWGRGKERGMGKRQGKGHMVILLAGSGVAATEVSTVNRVSLSWGISV